MTEEVGRGLRECSFQLGDITLSFDTTGQVSIDFDATRPRQDPPPFPRERRRKRWGGYQERRVVKCEAHRFTLPSYLNRFFRNPDIQVLVVSFGMKGQALILWKNGGNIGYTIRAPKA